jgi:surface polysaccharide O-acyltransferase-like enzyme
MDKYLSIKLKGLSFFLIIMVICLHANNLNTGNLGDYKGYSLFVQNFLSGGIARVSVPLFFCISGYLYFLNLNGTPSEFIIKFKKRIKTLFIPYLFWSLWGMFIFIVLQSLPQSKAFFNSAPILHSSIPQLLSTIFLDPLPYQLWFVRDLMVLVLFSPVLYFLIKYLSYFIIIFFLLTWVFSIPFYLFSYESVLFFTIGGFIGMKRKDLLTIRFSKKYLVFTFLWIALALFDTILVHIDFQNKYIISEIANLNVFIGIFALWSLYDIIFTNRDLQDSKLYPFFAYTFFLYAFQEPMLTIMKKGMLFAIGGTESATLVIYFCTIAGTISISLIVGYGLNKLAPKFYGTITGGR